MPISILIRDETFASKVVTELIVKLSQERLTAADLIAARVEAECYQRLTKLQDDPTKPAPSSLEMALNTKIVKPSVVDIEAEVAKALTAFDANAFFVLVDDKQVESLDAQLFIRPDTVVTFLRLTPLKGG